jgi:hypothetical protein
LESAGKGEVVIDGVRVADDVPVSRAGIRARTVVLSSALRSTRPTRAAM